METVTYQEKLKELQNTFCEGASSLLTIHINYIIKKYGNWNKYPRKIKKFLKNYLIILIIAIIINIISSLTVTFLLPPLIKLIIKIYV